MNNVFIISCFGCFTSTLWQHSQCTVTLLVALLLVVSGCLRYLCGSWSSYTQRLCSVPGRKLFSTPSFPAYRESTESCDYPQLHIKGGTTWTPISSLLIRSRVRGNGSIIPILCVKGFNLLMLMLVNRYTSWSTCVLISQSSHEKSADNTANHSVWKISVQWCLLFHSKTLCSQCWFVFSHWLIGQFPPGWSQGNLATGCNSSLLSDYTLIHEHTHRNITYTSAG